jgi:Ca2+-binding RTX toxin-like protein
MSIFIGSNAGETITPDVVSPSVTVIGVPKKPSAAVDLIFAGSGNDTVAGGGGDDIAFLGAGDDKFVWRPGDGNDFVDGGAGADRLAFNGSTADENIAVSAGALGLAQVVQGVNRGSVTSTQVERIEIAALDGQDRITVNDLAHTDVKDVAVDLAGAANSNAGDGQADVVVVNGSQAGEQISVGLQGGTVVVNGLSAKTTIDHADAGIDQLVVSAGGGNDRIDASALPADSILLTLDGGAGDDTILGSQGADVLLGGDGNDLINGGRGNDVAFLGSGDDTFVWNPGDGSDTVEGGDGTDTMVFNGANIAENIDISANGERVLFTRNVANITMDLNDVEHIHFAALGGADKITVNDLSGTDVTQVDIDLAGAPNTGDGAQDQVAVNGSAGNDAITVGLQGDAVVVHGLSAEVTIENAEAQNDTLVLNGGVGDDSIDASGLAAGHIGVQLNGGDGVDRLIGSAGDDLINGGRGNDVALMGAGNDTFVWNPGDGSDTVEGQAGVDTMLFNGANINEKIDISANGTRALFTRDVASIAMDLSGVEHINFTALGGADQIVVHDLSGTDVSQVNVDLAATQGGTAGDNTVDTVEIDGTNGSDVISLSMRADGALVVDGLASAVVIEHFDPTDEIHINGLGGDDVINAAALGSNGPHITLDGGEGDDVLLGGAGDDTLLGGAGDDVLLGNAGFDTLDGGPGDNVLIQDSATPAPSPSASAYGDVHPDADHATGEQMTLDHGSIASSHSSDLLL